MALWRGSARRAAWAGATASVLFVAVLVLEDLLSPGFNWLSKAVSLCTLQGM